MLLAEVKGIWPGDSSGNNSSAVYIRIIFCSL